jgi:hypothetical protein
MKFMVISWHDEIHGDFIGVEVFSLFIVHEMLKSMKFSMKIPQFFHGHFHGFCDSSELARCA